MPLYIDNLEIGAPRIIDFFTLDRFEQEYKVSSIPLPKIIALPIVRVDEEDELLSNKNELIPLQCNDPDLISLIEKRYNKYNEKVIIDKILPLVDNDAFFNLITLQQIPFSSKNDTELADRYCYALLELGKKRGLRKAGNPNGGQNYINKANAFAKEIGPMLDKIDEEGHTSYNKKAAYLNKRDIKAIRGGKWEASSVRGVWVRWKKLNITSS